MKKQYVKPVMESEAFVANEYVAACWTITCTKDDDSCGSELIRGVEQYPSSDMLKLSGDEDTGIGVYYGTIEGQSGCRTETNPKDYDISNWIDFWRWLYDLITGNTTTSKPFHPVSVTDGYETEDNKFHPNASV